MLEATTDALVSEADITSALGGGEGGDPAPTSTPAPAATTPPASPPPVAPEATTPAAPAEPVASTPPSTPAEAELEIAPGRKVKASDILTWEKNHTAFEGIKPLRDLDAFLSRPEQKELAEAMTGLLASRNPVHVKQVLALLAGSAPANGAGTPPPADPFAEMEKDLDLTDPSVKRLYDGFKAIQARLGELDQFRTSTKTAQEEAAQAQRVSDAETRLKTSMDEAWKTHQFDALLGRIDEKYRGETGNLLRKMILTMAGLPGPNQLPMAQVAKTLHGQMSGLIEGVINAYVASKKAPPAGGGRGPVTTSPATPQLGSDDMQAAIVEGLKASQATRE